VSPAQRGEIWLIDLGMVAKTRPALILSVAFDDRERAVFTYVPRTTVLRGTRFEVPHTARGFDPGGFDPGGFDAQGIGRCAQRAAHPPPRRGRRPDSRADRDRRESLARPRLTPAYCYHPSTMLPVDSPLGIFLRHLPMSAEQNIKC
jgi:hypothetical protein